MSCLVPKEEFKKRLIEIIENASTQDKNKRVIKFKDVLLDNSNYGKHPTKPRQMSFEIDSTTETAYQRAILKSEKTSLNYKIDNNLKTVQWLDGELPIVCNKNPRRRSIDLIGSIGGILTFCELKFNKSKDSPVYAVVELLTNYYFIQLNADILDIYKVFHKNKNLKHFKWNDITNNGLPRLIVCANKSYWDTWWTKYDKAELINQVYKWGMHLGTNIDLFQSEDFDFKIQKGEGKYTPTIPVNSIWEIIKD